MQGLVNVMDGVGQSRLEPFFCYSEHFAKDDKDGSHLVQGLVNVGDDEEYSRLDPIFFVIQSIL